MIQSLHVHVFFMMTIYNIKKWHEQGVDHLANISVGRTNNQEIVS